MENTSSSISVIIPVRNGGAVLSRCLDSVFAQTLIPGEVIVVDNGSTDETPSIIDAYCRQYPRLKSVQEPRIGRGAARATGVLQSRGEIIVMLDADCVAPQTWLRSLIAPICDRRASVVMGFIQDSAHTFWSRQAFAADRSFLARLSQPDGTINHFLTSNCAVRRDVFLQFPFDQALPYNEDFDVWLRFRQAYRVYFLPDVIVAHFYKASFIQTVRASFWRGYWLYPLFKKYPPDIRALPMFESVSLVNYLRWPLWLASQVFKRSPGSFFYLVVTEISWRTGLVCSAVVNRKLI